ncbi:hypothetical protein [Micromonospora tulbaghiae]|uniref:hypothetical protein n=1 Tax=Micromonospora tulbaghiae TaxID=479978 RepID=UPI003EBADD0F
MRIDDRIESLVREALTAVVKSDAERLERALLAFGTDDALVEGVQLATAVSLHVLRDAYGREPDGDEVRAVADKIVEMEDWTDVGSDEVFNFVSAASAGRRADAVLPADRIAPLAFVIAGNLLSSCCKEGEFWYNYLDRIEAQIESATGS